MTLDLPKEPNADFVKFLDEAPGRVVAQTSEYWRILVVDDDAGVHHTVEFALRDVTVFGRKFEFLNAYSGQEALEMLRHETHIAAILLDVVMEHEHACLALVKQIREELHITDTRIILHTGQPGFAPEISAIRDYDINDYRTKSELTRNHIYTCLASAVRTYRQIQSIETSRQQLRHIIAAGSALINETNDVVFASSVLAQFAELLKVPVQGFVTQGDLIAPAGQSRVIWASENYSASIGRELLELYPVSVRNCCTQNMQHAGVRWCDSGASLKICARNNRFLLVFLDAQASTKERVDEIVIETFAAHFASCIDNRSLMDTLHHDAYFDRLLDLPNRRSLGEMLDACYTMQRQRESVLALIDIDRFGEINDALGQTFGDALLQAMATRLRLTLPVGVSLARISADVFAVLGHHDMVTPEALLPLFATPFNVLGEETMVSVTIGLTRLIDVESDGGSAALEAAFQALRDAKSRQRGQLAWYTRDLSRRTLERVTLLNGLRQSLRNTGLFVVFQPQIDLPGQNLIGLEALVRWRSESGTLIPPDRFIPVAEQAGLICQIGFFVLRESLAVLSTLHTRGFRHVRMAVNVSAVQFRQTDFLQELRRIIYDSGIDPHHLELEITESIAMEDAAYVRETLEALRTLGIQLAIDDFGTGFSSLAQIKRLSIDRLKIDRAFVQDLDENELEASIAGVVIQLGQRLGIQVIAEGVETNEQSLLLQHLGCSQAQGFLFGRPMVVDDLHQWMHQHRTKDDF